MTAWLERHRFLLTFALLSLFMGVSVGLAKVTTTLYALHLGAQGWVLGSIAAAQSLGLLFSSLPMGVLVERYGPTRLFMAGSLIAGLLYLLLPLLPSSLFLLCMTALVSLVMPARFVSLNTVFMAALERMGEARAGWYRGTHMSGMFLIGPLLAAVVVQVLGHAGSYWLIAAMFFVTIGLSPLVLSQYRAPRRDEGWQDAGMGEVLRGVLADPLARRLAWHEGAIQALNMYYAFYIVVIAVQSLGLPAAGAGSLVAVQGAAFVFALFLLGGWVGRLGRQALSLGALLVVLAALTLAFAARPVWLWGGGAMLGLGLGLLQIHNLTQFSRVGARLGHGRVAGFSALAGPAGSLVGGLLGGTLGQWIGLQMVFLVFVPLFLSLALLSRRHPLPCPDAA